MVWSALKPDSCGGWGCPYPSVISWTRGRLLLWRISGVTLLGRPKESSAWAYSMKDKMALTDIPLEEGILGEVVHRSLVAVEALHIRHIEAEEVHNLAGEDSLRHVAALGRERRTYQGQCSRLVRIQATKV